jgi:hypothetical protein
LNDCTKPLFATGASGFGKTQFLDDVLSFLAGELSASTMTAYQDFHAILGNYTVLMTLKINFAMETRFDLKDEGSNPAALILARLLYAINPPSDTFGVYRSSSTFLKDMNIGLVEFLDQISEQKKIVLLRKTV